MTAAEQPERGRAEGGIHAGLEPDGALHRRWTRISGNYAGIHTNNPQTK